MSRRNFFIFSISGIILILFLILNPFNNTGPRNIILVGWDGVGRDNLHNLLTQQKLPNLKRLIEQGRLVDIDNHRRTDTMAGWAAVLTGYEPEISGVYSNQEYQTIPPGYTIFERLEKYLGQNNIATAAIISKNKLGCEPPDGPYVNAGKKMDIFIHGLGDSRDLEAKISNFLKDYSQRRFFLFIHYADPDRMGHAFGEGSDEMNQAIIVCDAKLGDLLQQLEKYKISDKTLVYVTADHGFDKGAKHHYDAPFIFLATNDQQVIRKGLITDITPTILTRFGLKLDSITPALSGRSLSEKIR
jgi:predicted AlkP superfamily pyrophosphatase or phosphodiesterase